MINTNGVLDISQAPLPKSWSTGESQKNTSARTKPDPGGSADRGEFSEVLEQRMERPHKSNSKGKVAALASTKKAKAQIESPTSQEGIGIDEATRPQSVSAKLPTSESEGDLAPDELERPRSNVKSEALLKFMDSMESDFGIRPQRLLRAMASLNKDDLLAAPGESAAKIIQQLHLTPPQEKAATELFLGTLTAPVVMQAQSNFAQPDGAHPKFKEGNLADLVSAMRRVDIDREVQEMGRRFFSIQPADVDKLASLGANQLGHQAVPSPSAALGMAQQDYAATSEDTGQIPVLGGDLRRNLFEDWASQPRQTSALPMQNPLLAQMDEGSQVLPPSTSAPEISAYGLVSAAQALPRMVQGPGGETHRTSQATAHQGAKAYEQMAALNPTGEMISISSEPQESSGEGDLSGRGEQFDLSWLSAGQGPAPKSPVSFASAFFAGNNVSQPNLRSENINEIVQQSQILVRKGGGEMKIELKPEGMGYLNLKVGVDEGRVTIDILTDSPVARKQLEGSLADLRSHLEQNKLQVDHLRVNMLDRVRDDLYRDQSDSANRHAQHEAAREFLGDFREFNRARQENLFSAPEMRGYKQPNRQMPEPIGQNARAARVSRQGASLNLVA